MVYRNDASRLGAGFISVYLETRWLGQNRGFYEPEPPCSLVSQSAGLLIPRSSVRFRQKLRKLRTEIYTDFSYTDPQARVQNCCFK